MLIKLRDVKPSQKTKVYNKFNKNNAPKTLQLKIFHQNTTSKNIPPSNFSNDIQASNSSFTFIYNINHVIKSSSSCFQPNFLELVPFRFPHLLGCISNQLTHKALERCVSGILKKNSIRWLQRRGWLVFLERIDILVIGIGDIYIYICIYKYIHMGVSKNRGTPKSSILIRFSIINHPFWGTTIVGNIHIYIYIYMWQGPFCIISHTYIYIYVYMLVYFFRRQVWIITVKVWHVTMLEW